MKKALAFGALPLVLLFVTAFQSSNSDPRQLATIQSQISSLESQNSSLMSQISSLEEKLAAKDAKDANGPREFYLAKTFHSGGTALSACAKGYHMASLWEIHDPSNLRYNTELGMTSDDSGFGPPTFGGWIRTSFSSSGSHAPPGQGNCNAYTTPYELVNGTLVRLDFGWTGPANSISPWRAEAASCNLNTHVWCVQD